MQTAQALISSRMRYHHTLTCTAHRSVGATTRSDRHILTISQTTGLLDILSTTELAYFCRTDGEINTNTSPVNSNIQDLVIAIGAQCQSLASAQNAGERYFRRAQLSSFSTMLESPSVDMVRIFLLMSFYMLGQCRRNTAFMYLGIAARAATSVGLHSGESYTNTSDPDVQFRYVVGCAFFPSCLRTLTKSLIGNRCG